MPKVDKSRDSHQSERFTQAARELGCDDDEARFAETVRKIAQPKPKLLPSKGKKQRS